MSCHAIHQFICHLIKSKLVSTWYAAMGCSDENIIIGYKIIHNILLHICNKSFQQKTISGRLTPLRLKLVQYFFNHLLTLYCVCVFQRVIIISATEAYLMWGKCAFIIWIHNKGWAPAVISNFIHSKIAWREATYGINWALVCSPEKP